MCSIESHGESEKSRIPVDKSELYDKLIGTHPNIERKGASMGYTSLNGHMFTLLGPSGILALRLPEEEREKFLKKHKARLYEAYGAVMKEHVAVPDSLFQNTNELKKYLVVSYEYIATLKPQPTKKKR
jgi:TfoX/Sxy family transcriptional regulator of competence genes